MDRVKERVNGVKERRGFVAERRGYGGCWDVRVKEGEKERKGGERRG